MIKKAEKLNNAVFIVTDEKSCPYYDVSDQLIVKDGSLSISPFKSVCLILASKIQEIVGVQQSFSHFPKMGGTQLGSAEKKTVYGCGGCTGHINFEFKRDKAYATLQMKMLKESSELRRKQHLRKFYRLMRDFSVFDPLEDESLKDLTLFLEFKTLLADKVLVKKGTPGGYLYIVIKGRVAIVDDYGQRLAMVESGELLGEMSLLTDEPEANSIHTVTSAQVAMLSVKNFRKIIKAHPMLQIFLFKLLVDRVQTTALREGKISSGMSGELAEVPAIDLMQMINSSQKTGCVEVACTEGKARVYFNEGEIILAEYHKLQGKDAVFALLKVDSGHFTYSKGIPEEYNSYHPIGGFIGLMMEGVQMIDELNAGPE